MLRLVTDMLRLGTDMLRLVTDMVRLVTVMLRPAGIDMLRLHGDRYAWTAW